MRAISKALLLFFFEEEEMYFLKNIGLMITQGFIHSTLCKIKFTFLSCNKSRNEKHGAPAPTGFAEFLWDQKTHLHGTGASTSLKSTAYLFYLHCGEKILLGS